MTDRHLPDKAIDALDEVGSRVHLQISMYLRRLLILREKIEDLKDKKNEVIKSQQYEKAAELRDDERNLRRIRSCKEKWEEESKINRVEVDRRACS